MNSTILANTLPPNTAKLLTDFAEKKPDWASYFYLSGGTALSLQIGHRESEDLDFFSQQPFEPSTIERQLQVYGKLSETQLSEGTLNTYLNGVKLQFLYYPYKLIQPTMEWQNIQLSSVVDIACTKLQTVGMRGSKKDFIDLFFLLQQFTLPQLFQYTNNKYAESDYSQMHILKSLVYFEDAEAQPMPRMHQKVSWEIVKDTITTAVKSTSLFN